MLSKRQIMSLIDFCVLFTHHTEKLVTEVKNSTSIEPILKGEILHEQNRRLGELTRIKTSLEAELDTSNEGSKTVCPDPTASPERRAAAPETKRKGNGSGKKSKPRAAGTSGTSNSVKNANGGRKQKRNSP